MASKRHLRRKRCERKAYHATEADAKREAWRLGTRIGEWLSVYRCSNCGGFHVGHRPGYMAKLTLKGR